MSRFAATFGCIWRRMIPEGIAIAAPCGVPMTRATTINTDAMFCFNMLISAFSRAIFHFAISRTICFKYLPTFYTRSCFTIITDLRPRRTLNKYLVTSTAYTLISAIWESMIKLGPLFPTFNFCPAMTFRTKSNQIRQFVCIYIMIPKSKRLNMMYRKQTSQFAFSTLLTNIIIAFTCFTRLFIPIRTSVIFVASTPIPIVRTSYIRTFHNAYYT